MSQSLEAILTDRELGAEFGRQTEAATASASSDGGEATVTVDSTGGMTGLYLSEHAMRLTADELASIILDTSGRAQAKMAKQMVDLVNDIYGPESPTASFVSGAYLRQFPQRP